MGSSGFECYNINDSVAFEIFVTFADVGLTELAALLIQGEGQQGIGIFVLMVRKNTAQCFRF